MVVLFSFVVTCYFPKLLPIALIDFKETTKYMDSITDETSLEEFLAKAQLAGTEFTAEREQFRVIEKLVSIRDVVVLLSLKCILLVVLTCCDPFCTVQRRS